jgi:hypothetical protein
VRNEAKSAKYAQHIQCGGKRKSHGYPKAFSNDRMRSTA